MNVLSTLLFSNPRAPEPRTSRLSNGILHRRRHDRTAGYTFPTGAAESPDLVRLAATGKWLA